MVFPVVFGLSWALMPRPVLWGAVHARVLRCCRPAVLRPAAAVTLANQAAALRLGRTEEPRRRKAIVAAAVTVDLGVLGLFKYYGFFA